MTPEELKRRRKRLNMNQTKLAKLLKVHMMTLSRWERGVIEIPHMVEANLREVEATHLPEVEKKSR